MAMVGTLATALGEVRTRIAAAARRSGRDSSAVRLMAVTKGFPRDVVVEAHSLGLTLFGENRVQEAEEKYLEPPGPLELHLIGHLQRNKARLAVSLFDLIHTLDSAALAAVLDRLGGERGAPVRALVEVNLGGEESKSGVGAGELPAFLEGLAPLGNLRVEGLMAIPPPARDEAEARAYFRTLRRLRDELAAAAPPNVVLRELSMGMTDDFEIAVEEGATLVRVGRAIFGERG
jgi:hypothetical protein